MSHPRVCPSEYYTAYIRVPGIQTSNHRSAPNFTIPHDPEKQPRQAQGYCPACVWFLGPEAGTSHVARLLGQGVVHWQSKLDATILLPAPPDSGELAAEAGEQEEAFGQDHDAGHQQRERERGRQVELVMAVFEGAGPAIGECVQGAQHQGHKAQSGLREKGKLGLGTGW